jgi:superfamily II DNA or RNA helicase
MKETPWDVVICDEAHRDEFGVVVRSSPRWLYGFTATPWRDDGRLGDWYGCNMLELIRYSEAIAQHYIVPARVYAPDVPDLSGVDVAGADYDVAQVAETLSKLGVIGNAVDTWLAKARGEKTVVFCANVAHAEETTAAFQGRGIQAACVTGETPEAERRISMARFRVGTITVLVNVAVFTEGLDVADASVIVLLRPTHSRSLYMQIAGRGGRASPGKTHYRLFDHTGSCFEHGSPTQDHQWVLEPKSTRKRASDGPAVTFRRCEKCFFVFAPGDTQCPNCAAPNTTRPVKHKNGTLVEVDLEAYKPLTGFIDAFNKARRKAFAEASAMGIKGPRAFGMVNAALKETKAVLRGQHQIVVPKNTDLLW